MDGVRFVSFRRNFLVVVEIGLDAV